MKDKTLVDEICDDHEQILIDIKRICRHRTIGRSALQRLTMTVGAHHLAEEETLYGALHTIAREDVGQAQVYHLVLDDLTHAIECGDHSDDPLRYQLLLLENLLENHFQMEENELLETFVNTFSRQQQIDLGGLYRQRYLQNIAVLAPRPASTKFPARTPPELLR